MGGVYCELFIRKSVDSPCNSRVFGPINMLVRPAIHVHYLHCVTIFIIRNMLVIFTEMNLMLILKIPIRKIHASGDVAILKM